MYIYTYIPCIIHVCIFFLNFLPLFAYGEVGYVFFLKGEVNMGMRKSMLTNIYFFSLSLYLLRRKPLIYDFFLQNVRYERECPEMER